MGYPTPAPGRRPSRPSLAVNTLVGQAAPLRSGHQLVLRNELFTSECRLMQHDEKSIIRGADAWPILLQLLRVLTPRVLPRRPCDTSFQRATAPLLGRQLPNLPELRLEFSACPGHIF